MFHVKPDSSINLGVAFPACDIKEKTLEKYQKVFKKDGVNLRVISKSSYKKYAPFRDSAKNRAKEIEELFIDDEIDVIICARGGFGSQQLVEHINYDLIKKHPKIIIGYSDTSILLNDIYNKTGFITYHGPMLKEFYNIKTRDYLKKLSWLLGGKLSKLSNKGLIKKASALKTGQAKGKIVGGNLASICSVIGTKSEISFKNNILYLEEVDEEFYQVDRFITILCQNKSIFSCKAIVFCNFSKIKNNKIKYSITLKKLFLQRLAEFKGPIVWGYPMGHKDNKNFVPIGKECRIDASENSVSIQF
jgi:muramoyltetrapeptide carboxypeptidase